MTPVVAIQIQIQWNLQFISQCLEASLPENLNIDHLCLAWSSRSLLGRLKSTLMPFLFPSFLPQTLSTLWGWGGEDSAVETHRCGGVWHEEGSQAIMTFWPLYIWICFKYTKTIHIPALDSQKSEYLKFNTISRHGGQWWRREFNKVSTLDLLKASLGISMKIILVVEDFKESVL